MLAMIGLGLFDQKDITVRGLELVKSADFVYLESYTSLLSCSVEDLSSFYGKEVRLLDRTGVESEIETVLEQAKEHNVAFLVVGDVFSATTHSDLFLRAKEQEIAVQVVPNASVLTAVGQTGLSLYKFGRTTTIVYPEPSFAPESFFDVIEQNLRNKLHTLCLLDIKMDQNRFMTCAEGAQILLDISNKRENPLLNPNSPVVLCARLGAPDQKIISSNVMSAMTIEMGEPLHCVVVAGPLDVIENETLSLWKKL